MSSSVSCRLATRSCHQHVVYHIIVVVAWIRLDSPTLAHKMVRRCSTCAQTTPMTVTRRWNCLAGYVCTRNSLESNELVMSHKCELPLLPRCCSPSSVSGERRKATVFLHFHILHIGSTKGHSFSTTTQPLSLLLTNEQCSLHHCRGSCACQ